MRITSDETNGFTVTIELPKTLKQGGAIFMKVLVVDDEQHVREGIRLLGDWERYGIDEIYEAANGEEALRLIQTYKPDIIFFRYEDAKDGWH
ncbi:hypothetical protein GCM10020331_039940 [Ectobacillus funiculus]